MSSPFNHKGRYLNITSRWLVDEAGRTALEKRQHLPNGDDLLLVTRRTLESNGSILVELNSVVKDGKTVVMCRRVLRREEEGGGN